MNHSRDNVFPGSAFPLDQHRHVRTRQLGQAFANSLHGLGPAQT